MAVSRPQTRVLLRVEGPPIGAPLPPPPPLQRAAMFNLLKEFPSPQQKPAFEGHPTAAASPRDRKPQQPRLHVPLGRLMAPAVSPSASSRPAISLPRLADSIQLHARAVNIQQPCDAFDVRTASLYRPRQRMSKPPLPLNKRPDGPLIGKQQTFAIAVVADPGPIVADEGAEQLRVPVQTGSGGAPSRALVGMRARPLPCVIPAARVACHPVQPQYTPPKRAARAKFGYGRFGRFP